MDRMTVGSVLTRAQVALVFFVLTLGVLASGCWAEVACAKTLDDGVYEVSVTVYQAESDQTSMCDQALVSPAKLMVNGDASSLQLELQPIELAGKAGYLGRVEYYPDWKSSKVPNAKSGTGAKVVSTFGKVTDEYNGKKSEDSVVKGQKYPKVVSLKWRANRSQCFLRVYVPVMNAIAPGNGWQFVRLSVDYASAKLVGKVDGGKSGSSSTQPTDEPSSSSSSSSKDKSSSSSGSGSGGKSNSGSDSGSGSSSGSSVASSASSATSKGGRVLAASTLPVGTSSGGMSSAKAITGTSSSAKANAGASSSAKTEQKADRQLGKSASTLPSASSSATQTLADAGTPAASGVADPVEKKPPLQGMLVPFAIVCAVAAVLGVGAVLFRRRKRLFGKKS